MQQNATQPAGYCERGLLTVVIAPRLILEETLVALLQRESSGAVVVTCGHGRDGIFAQMADGYPNTSVIRAVTPSRLTAIIRTSNAPLIVIVHDPEIYRNDEESAARAASLLREYACSCAIRIVLLGRPGDAYLDEMRAYAGRYIHIERDCEWKDGRMICDRQMTLDAVG